MSHRNPCVTRAKAPKVRWPNEATAAWWIANNPSGETRGLEPYACPRCGFAHIGHPLPVHKTHLVRQ